MSGLLAEARDFVIMVDDNEQFGCSEPSGPPRRCQCMYEIYVLRQGRHVPRLARDSGRGPASLIGHMDTWSRAGRAVGRKSNSAAARDAGPPQATDGKTRSATDPRIPLWPISISGGDPASQLAILASSGEMGGGWRNGGHTGSTGLLSPRREGRAGLWRGLSSRKDTKEMENGRGTSASWRCADIGESGVTPLLLASFSFFPFFPWRHRARRAGRSRSGLLRARGAEVVEEDERRQARQGSMANMATYLGMYLLTFPYIASTGVPRGPESAGWLQVGKLALQRCCSCCCGR